MNRIFTSESVTEGHPDKIADTISDAILDSALEQDPNSRVACETFTNTGMVYHQGLYGYSQNCPRYNSGDWLYRLQHGL